MWENYGVEEFGCGVVVACVGELWCGGVVVWGATVCVCNGVCELWCLAVGVYRNYHL